MQKQTYIKKPPFFQKRCARCQQLFDIPNIKESPAREKLIEYYPCSFCGYIKSHNLQEKNKTGRCRDCFIPFVIIDEHALGYCHRCYTKNWRIINKKSQN